MHQGAAPFAGRADRAQSPGGELSGPHLLLYDGDCGLCHGLVTFVLARDRAGAIHYAALQGQAAASHLARYGRHDHPVTTVIVVKDYLGKHPELLLKGKAVLFVMGILGWPWKAARALNVFPTRWVDHGYDFVARHRYAVWGRRDSCVVPQPEFIQRFLDPVGAASAGGRREDDRSG